MRTLQFGMPTLIETNSIESCVKLNKNRKLLSQIVRYLNILFAGTTAWMFIYPILFYSLLHWYNSAFALYPGSSRLVIVRTSLRFFYLGVG